MTKRLASLVCATLLAIGPTAAAQSTDSRADEIKSLISKYHDYRLFNGSALVAENGEVIFKGGFGEADMSWDIPNTPDTKFRIGSVTKQFTAALILQLYEEGRIDLQAPVTEYLPEYPEKQGDRVTIHHLLTHTSGIPSYTGMPGFMEFTRDPYEVDSMLAMFSGLDLEFEPGEQWAYNNSGYFLLGAVIEAVTDQPYDEVLRARILDPLDLDDTGYDHYREIVERKATGYMNVGSGYAHAPYLDSSVPYAAGMMYSTVEDLLKWDQHLYAQGPFDRKETLDLMFEEHAPMGSGEDASHYAYGWIIKDLPVGGDTVEVVEHGGGIFGFTTGFWRIPEDRRTVILMDNTNSGGSVSALGDGLIKILYGEEAQMPKRPITDEMRRTIDDEGIEAAVARYEELSETAKDEYDFSEQQLNGLGYQYLGEGEIEIAKRLFQLNVEHFPKSANVYDSLGEAYMEGGDNEKAIELYKKALEINPGFENSKQMLRRLGVEVEDPDVDLPQETLEEYVGRYELAPTFIITITREGEQMYAQATGQPQIEIFPSAKDKFYLKAVEAQLTFNRTEGEVRSVTLHQGGRDMPGKKIE